eukprot:2194454-Rhodomonas_salina.1
MHAQSGQEWKASDEGASEGQESEAGDAGSEQAETASLQGVRRGGRSNAQPARRNDQGARRERRTRGHCLGREPRRRPGIGSRGRKGQGVPGVTASSSDSLSALISTLCVGHPRINCTAPSRERPPASRYHTTRSLSSLLGVSAAPLSKS